MPTRYRLAQAALYSFLFVGFASLTRAIPIGHWLLENCGVSGLFSGISIYAAALCASVFGLRKITSTWSFDELPPHSSEKVFGSFYYVEVNQIVIEETKPKKPDDFDKPEYDV
ncbi:hypothetical protein IFT66_23260 [Rhizobium sp. CFBP 13726]|jgi:hypothetical protein|uniref:hypothetical protein n=1 Tax=Rhizobium sp. CFBP 13726 TaxID=2775296 RepID=UPI001782AC9A|nr:hypothetical protein [Rhizobium sp. CFBP 13726]MBD8654002.1 hypothetical protein [Rhizobium sp. CFBP 13726]